MQIELTALIGLVCAAIGAAAGLLTFRRTLSRDLASSGKNEGVILTELGYVKAGVDDIRRKQEQQGEQHIEVVSRLTAVEASAKQAHKRLDNISERG